MHWSYTTEEVTQLDIKYIHHKEQNKSQFLIGKIF